MSISVMLRHRHMPNLESDNVKVIDGRIDLRLIIAWF